MKSTTSLFTNKKVFFLMATLCCLLWGSAYPAIKKGYELFHLTGDDIPDKLVFAGCRFTLAGILLLFLALLSGKALGRFQSGKVKQLAILGASQTAVQYVFFYIGLA